MLYSENEKNGVSRLVFDGSADEFLAAGDPDRRFYELSREGEKAPAA